MNNASPNAGDVWEKWRSVTLDSIANYTRVRRGGDSYYVRQEQDAYRECCGISLRQVCVECLRSMTTGIEAIILTLYNLEAARNADDQQMDATTPYSVYRAPIKISPADNRLTETALKRLEDDFNSYPVHPQCKAVSSLGLLHMNMVTMLLLRQCNSMLNSMDIYGQSMYLYVIARMLSQGMIEGMGGNVTSLDFSLSTSPQQSLSSIPSIYPNIEDDVYIPLSPDVLSVMLRGCVSLLSSPGVCCINGVDHDVDAQLNAQVMDAVLKIHSRASLMGVPDIVAQTTSMISLFSSYYGDGDANDKQ